MNKRYEYVEVKIVKSLACEGWYDDSAGKIFTAYEQTGDYFRVIHADNTEEFTRIIYKEDCEIVSGDIRKLSS